MLVPIKPSGNKPPIFVVHGHGLNVLNLKPLADYLHPKQPLLAIQARGLADDEDPLDTIPDIAKCYLDEIKKYDASAPLILAGYSSGGVVAYEMRRQLETMGKKVKILIVFDGSAETVNVNNENKWNKIKLLKIKWAIKHPFLAFRNKIQWILKKNNLSSDLKSYFKKLDPIFQLYDRAFESYQMISSQSVIHLFRADERTLFEVDSKFLGWEKYTGNEIRVHRVPGNHDTMLKEPHVKEFAKILQNLLDTC